MSYTSLSERALTNLPIRVRMWGFESDTYTLARAGWQFSMAQSFKYGNSHLDVAMRHETNHNCFMMARGEFAPQEVFMGALLRNADLQDLYDKAWIEVYVCSMGGINVVVPFRSQPNFKAWDVLSPVVYDRIEQKDFKLQDIAPFRTFDNSKELVVDPKDVNQLMDLILGAQKPTQEKILKKQEMDRRIEELHNGARPKQELHLSLVSNL